MATQEEIAILALEIRTLLEDKGFVFGTFAPDFQALFTQVYAQVILTYGGGGGGPIDGGDIVWDNVTVADLLDIISGNIKKTDLYIDLADTIDEIPDLRNIVDNVLSNVSPAWSGDNIYGPGQIVEYLGFLWENLEAVLITPGDPPTDLNTAWKKVGTFNSIYDSVNGLTTLIFNAQQAADGAVSSTNILSSQLLGPDQEPGDPAIAGGIIYDNQQLIVGPEGAIAQATEQLQTDFLGVNGLADTSGSYLFDIILDSSVGGTLANTTSLLQTTVGANTGSIEVEQGLRAIAIGPDYSNTTVYSNNDVVNYFGELWQNNTGGNVGPEPWTVANWNRIDKNLYGQYSVKIDIDGYVAGFGLANDGATSDFIVRADRFSIVPSGGTGDAVIPFIVDALDNKVYIDNAYIRNITADRISLGTQVEDSVDYDTLGDIANFNKLMEDDFLLLATNSGEIVNQLPTITDGITNFNDRNDRISAPVDAPVIAGDGGAISFTFNTDGTANIDFEWIYNSGTPETNIDGFIVYIKSSDTSTVYDLNVDLTGSTFSQALYDQTMIRFMSLSPDKYYTIGIEAFRVVDTDIDASGIIRSLITQPGLPAEKTVFLTLTVPPPTLITVQEL